VTVTCDLGGPRRAERVRVGTMMGMVDSALASSAGPTLAADGEGLAHVDAFPVLRPVAPRYADLGGDGTISTVAVARWIEESRVEAHLPAFRRLVDDGGFAPFRILLAAQRMVVRPPLPPGRGYRVGVGVRRLGNASFSYGHGVFADGECVAIADSVTVLASAGGPTGLPDALRADLGALALDEPGGAGAPRPDPVRRERHRYPHTHPLTTRIGDVDTNRHVNNVALVSWYADAVAGWQSARLGDPDGGPPEALAPTAWEVQYLDEVAHPRRYEVGLAVDPCPDGGLHYRAGLFLDERCVGLADGFGAAGPFHGPGLAPRVAFRS
jgi:acyl-CoA thioester hydrolase